MEIKNEYLGIILVVVAVAGFATGWIVAPEPTPEEEKKVLRFLTTETAEASLNVLNEMISEYTILHPEIEIQLEATTWDEIYSKILAAVEAPPGYEILHGATFNIILLAKNGYLEPVNYIIEKNCAPEKTPDEEYYDFTRIVIDGNDYSVPYRTGPQFIWYRTDLFEQYNVDIPETWDDLLAAAETLTMDTDNDGTIDVYGYGLPAGPGGLTQELFTNFLMGNGAHFYITMENGEPKVIMDQEPLRSRIKETLQFYKDLMQFAPPDAGTYSYGETINSFVYRTAAMANYAGRLVVNVENTDPELGSVTGAMGFPHGPHWQDSPYAEGYITTYDTRGGTRFGPTPSFSYGWCTMKNSNYPLEGLKFIEFASEHKNALKIWNTVPLHEEPAIKSRREIGWYMDNPILQKHLDDVAFANEYEAKGSYSWHTPDGIEGDLFTGVGDMFGSMIITNMVQSVVVNDVDPDVAIDNAAQELRELLAG